MDSLTEYPLSQKTFQELLEPWMNGVSNPRYERYRKTGKMREKTSNKNESHNRFPRINSRKSIYESDT